MFMLHAQRRTLARDKVDALCATRLKDRIATGLETSVCDFPSDVDIPRVTMGLLGKVRNELRNFKALGDDQVLTIFHRLCKGFNTPFSLWASSIVERDPKEILNLEASPMNYDNPVQYFMDRQVCELLRKYPFKSLTTADERRDAALESVLKSERRCAETNKVFRSRQRLPGTAEAVLSIARCEIDTLLRKLDVRAVIERCRFGPGLTAGLDDSSRVAFYHKIKHGRPTASPSLRPFLRVLFQMHPGWARSAGFREFQDNYGDWFSLPNVEEVPHNRVTTVPKTAKTDRSIAIEPTVNQFLQLGTGAVLRDALKRWSIDLEHGQETHRRLAAFGSIHPWLLATLDLASASDTISTEVVRELLPPDWFHWLDLLRSQRGILPDGSEITYAKFSSMGNGFTFELETLIFTSLVRAVYIRRGLKVPKEARVYGDDIVVTNDVVDELKVILDTFGFEINQKKSFTTHHPFRESCGADFFAGVAVRPLYLTKEINSVTRLVDVLNRLYRHAGGNSLDEGDRAFRFARLYLLDLVPGSLKKLTGPENLPGVLHGLRSGWLQRLVYDHAVQRVVLPSLVISDEAVSEEMEGYAAIIHAAERGATSGRVPLRNRTKIKVRFVWDPVTI